MKIVIDANIVYLAFVTFDMRWLPFLMDFCVRRENGIRICYDEKNEIVAEYDLQVKDIQTAHKQLYKKWKKELLKVNNLVKYPCPNICNENELLRDLPLPEKTLINVANCTDKIIICKFDNEDVYNPRRYLDTFNILQTLKEDLLLEIFDDANEVRKIANISSRISKSPSNNTLHGLLQKYFNLDDLKIVCSRIQGLSFEDLAGERISIKTLELIDYCQRRGIIEQLLNICKELRPRINWDLPSQS